MSDMDIEILRAELIKANTLNHKLSTKLDIAIEGLEALSFGGEPTGIANKTLEAIKELDLPQEGPEAKE